MAAKFSHVFITIAVFAVVFSQMVNCLSCYTCTSEDSLENCNSKLTKKECPSGTSNCLTGTLTCFARGEVTKIFFYKRCGTKVKGCEPSDDPSCPLSQAGWSSRSTNDCCTRDNCNAAPKNDTVNSGPLYKINGALTRMSILLAFLEFSYF
ncbi:hypothetical protein ABFA07_004675 [Porites harrisoni]